MGALYIRGGYGSTVHKEWLWEHYTKGVVMGALYIRGGYGSTLHKGVVMGALYLRGVVMEALYIRGGYGSTVHKGWLWEHYT